MSDVDETTAPAGEDALVEATVLRQLLALHPIQLNLDELLREVDADPADFAQRDAVERAVHELVAAGLLHRSGELLLASRAALRFDALLGE